MNATTQEHSWHFMTYLSQKRHIIFVSNYINDLIFLGLFDSLEKKVDYINVQATLPTIELDEHVKEKVISLFKKLLKLSSSSYMH